LSGGLHRPVVVAVAFARMMQMAGNEIILVVAVRDGFVAAARTMLVAFVVAAAVVLRRASGGIGATDLQLVFLDAGRGRMMQVAVV